MLGREMQVPLIAADKAKKSEVWNTIEAAEECPAPIGVRPLHVFGQ